MEVRDAVEEDAEVLAAIADAPRDAMRNLIHDRTVRVAAADRTSVGPNVDADAPETPDIEGFVSFDVRDGTVHVTQFGGSADACERLLAEPVRFAATEGMDVELIVLADDDELRAAAESAGFEKQGAGPTFRGDQTVRYRTRP